MTQWSAGGVAATGAHTAHFGRSGRSSMRLRWLLGIVQDVRENGRNEEICRFSRLP
jgi:hypothetical protein